MSRDEAKATASLAELFAQVDVNNNGKLEFSELTRVFGDFADQFLEYCDQDKDKEITCQEWTDAIIRDTAELSEEEFQAQWVVRMSESLTAAGAPAAVAMNPLKLGAAMANIDLETTQGPIKFADWLCGDEDRPWTIFFSHPADFTPVCTTELGQCHMMAPDFAAMGAQLIGVSCDSVDSHNEWAKDVVARATPDSAADPLAFPIIGE